MINPNSPFKCWNCGRRYTPKNNLGADLYCSRLCRKEARKQRTISRRQKKRQKETRIMKKQITITLSPEVVKRVKIQAIKDDTNFSALIEKLLRDWLKEARP